MTNILLKDHPNKNEIIEEIKNIYGDVLINDILNNKVIPSEKYANYTKSQRYDNIWRAIFLVLAVIAVLKILLIK